MFPNRERPMTAAGPRPTVVVVGGGYGGTAAAKALDEIADVVLVEPRDAFVHNVAALRALVDPDWLSRIFLPYDRLLEHGRVVRDRAVRVEEDRVTIASGDEIPADYVVLATGSTYPFPAKTNVHDTSEALERYRLTHEALAAAKRVLVLGAGPVGLELTGEITSAWPDKHVTIVDPADDIVTGPFDPALREELHSQLADRSIELILRSALADDPPIAAGTPGAFTVSTAAGKEISADIWFRAHGVTPVSDYLGDGLQAARTDAGLIEVTRQLRVAGHDRVFALGDISTADVKMAGRAGRQAEIVAANIRALIAGESELADYEPMPPVIVLPLGPTGGASQLPGSDVAGAETTAEIKGAHMFLDRYAELFGIAATAR
jgi:NADH dehydrogenase FAD-containing subunit